MSLLSWAGLTSDPEQDAANKAADQKTAAGQRAEIALSNYRQSSRNQYNKLLNARFAPYQGTNDRMAAAGLSGMHADLSAEANPVTLRDTGVGAAQGSNYLGYNTPGQGGGVPVHHNGLVEYLNGTALDPTTADRNQQLDQKYQNWLHNGGAGAQARGAQYRTSRGDQQVVDAEGGAPQGTGEGIPRYNPAGDNQPNGNYTPNQFYSNQAPLSTPYPQAQVRPAPQQQMSFFPRR